MDNNSFSGNTGFYQTSGIAIVVINSNSVSITNTDF